MQMRRFPKADHTTVREHSFGRAYANYLAGFMHVPIRKGSCCLDLGMDVIKLQTDTYIFLLFALSGP